MGNVRLPANDANGQPITIGQLNQIVNPNAQEGETSWAGRGKETVIVPVPGACSRYYLFYTLSGNFTTVLAYAIINCSGATPVIEQNSTRLGTAGYAGSPGLAVSKLRPDGTRRLYVTSRESADYYTLLSNGTLSSVASLVSVPNSLFSGSCEAELSPDGNWLAWASRGFNNASQVTVCSTINPNPVPFVPVYASGPNTGDVSGLEFSSGSDKLFVTGQGEATVYTISTQQQVPISTGSNTLALRTQLELAFDGLLYAASSTGRLLTINPNTLAVAPSPLTVSTFPLAGPGTDGVYGFPDQIDGENYTTYFGNNTPIISSGFLVDSRLLQRSSVTPVYSCNPLNFRITSSSADISRYDLIINSTDASGIITGAYAYTHSTTVLPVGLGALDNGYLANPANTGYYQVTVVGYNACQSVRNTARMQVSNLTPGSAGYAFNFCFGAGPQAAGTSPTAPAILGAYGGGGIDISFSTGDYDSYQVQFAQYVPGSNPAQFTPIGNLANIAKPTTGAGLSTIAPSYLAGQVGLAPNYFQLGQPGYDVLHQLTLTVKNFCGTSPPLLGYFQTANLSCRPVAGTTATTDKALLYPNPLTGAEVGHLRFTLPTAQPVSLVLTDALTGRVRLTVLRDAPRSAGAQEVSFDAATLPAGVYLYRLTTADGTTVGRVLKAD